MKKLIIGGLAGAVILFFWGMLSWMMIPWHKTTILSFQNEAAVKTAVTANAPKSGVYVAPSMASQNTQQTTAMQAPIIFSVVKLEQPMSMTYMMIVSFIIQFIAAVLVTWLLLQAKDASYGKRVAMAAVFGLTAGIVAHVPYWNWFGFPCGYTLVMMADLIIGWFLAGLAIAKISTR